MFRSCIGCKVLYCKCKSHVHVPVIQLEEATQNKI